MKPKTKTRQYFGNEAKKTATSHRHMLEMIKAKATRPDLERFIFRRIPDAKNF